MKNFLAAAAFAFGMAAVPASSATLVATTVLPVGGNGSFTIDFDDTNSNGLFDLAELTGFSGFLSTFGQTIVSVLSVPEILGFTVAGATPGATLFSGNLWNFEEDGLVDLNRDFGASTNNWTYELRDIAAVPLPASLPLLLAGLGLLGILRRRRA